MFIDDIKCDYYYPMGHKTVVLEVDKPVGAHKKSCCEAAIVDTRMVLFIDTLRAKRPTWKFKSIEAVSVVGQKLRDFKVFDGDEDLGCIWVESNYRTGDTRYCWNNTRRERRQQRGYGGFSSKVEMAAKKVRDEFYSQTIDERAESAQLLVFGFVDAALAAAAHKYYIQKNAVFKHLEDYIVRHWDELRPYAGASSGVELDKLAAASRDMARVVKDVSNGAGVMLAEEGDSFIYWRKNEKPRKVSLNELNDTQRAKVGMLKLLTEDAVVPGIGARREKTFFVTDEDLT